MATILPPHWRVHSYDAPFGDLSQHALSATETATIPRRARASKRHSSETRLQSVLEQGAESVRANAAALYLLNDETTHLNMHATWGLAEDEFLDSTRVLRNANADLEALVGHTVVIRDTTMSPWHVPQNCASAICTPVSTTEQLLGTLWFFNDHIREPHEHELNTVEIIAGRLALEVDRENLLREKHRARRSDLQVESAVGWRRDRLPREASVNNGNMIFGWSSPGGTLRGDFYDWVTMSDANVLLIGDTHSHTIEGSLELATLQSTARVIASQSIGAHDVVQQTGAALWAGSNRGQAATLGVLHFSPTTGMYEFAGAGSLNLMRVTPGITEQKIVDTELLGSDSMFDFSSSAGFLCRGEALLLVTEGISAIGKEFSNDFIETLINLSNWQTAHTQLDRWYIELGEKAPTGSLVMLRREV